MKDPKHISEIIKEIMARSIDDILKDADNAELLVELKDLWNEIANNKYQYTLVQLKFANEHIKELALKSIASDIEIGLFYNFLDTMFVNPK